MEIEKVKEIKKALKQNIKSGLGYEDNNKFCNVMFSDILTLINELGSENERLRVVFDIANERTYRKKFNDEWRKEYQKELNKQGNGNIAGYPDFDLVYKLYFEQKDRIAELEKENGELKQHVAEVEKGIIKIAKERNKKDELASKFIDSYNDSLKQFAEKLKKRLNLGLYEWQYAEVDSKTIDELLKEYIDEE